MTAAPGGASAANHHPAPWRGPLAAVALLTLGAAAGVGGVRLMQPVLPQTPSAPAAPVLVAGRPALDRRADGVFIPPASTYRDSVVVTPVVQRALDQTLDLPATIEADPSRVFNVLPPLGGRVAELRVGLGARVTRGQVLAVIDSGDLAQVYSDTDKARAQAALAHRALERARGLTQVGGGALKDAESAANDDAQAQAELARAESRLRTIAGSAAISGPRTLAVLAPAAGVVTALAIAPGSYINDPTQTMLTISNLDPVWVTANVPEKDIGFVARGQPVDVAFLAYPGETFHGTVLFVNALMEPDTRRTKVRIGLPNPDGRFQPNMYATATFHAPPRPALLVPDSSLLMDNDATTVFVERAPWDFVRRTVTPGYSADGMTVIERGLAPGDRVVSRGGVLLNE